MGLIACGLVACHAYFDCQENRVQRFLILPTLFVYGILLECIGIISKHHYYAEDIVMIFGIVPISIPLMWVGIIYSAMIIGERLELSTWKRIIVISLLSLSLDWGMDPIAVEIGLWTWVREGGSYFSVPSFNFIGWFLISIAYQLSYNLNWNREDEKKKLEILTIRIIDNQNTISRKLYTIFLVVPISLGLLSVSGLINLIPIVYNLPLIIVIILEVLTVAIASGALILKRNFLARSQWVDLIPPFILLFVACYYGFANVFVVQLELILLMFLTTIPLLIAFIFTLKKN